MEVGRAHPPHSTRARRRHVELLSLLLARVDALFPVLGFTAVLAAIHVKLSTLANTLFIWILYHVTVRVRKQRCLHLSRRHLLASRAVETRVVRRLAKRSSLHCLIDARISSKTAGRMGHV